MVARGFAHISQVYNSLDRPRRPAEAKYEYESAGGMDRLVVNGARQFPTRLPYSYWLYFLLPRKSIEETIVEAERGWFRDHKLADYDPGNTEGWDGQPNIKNFNPRK